MRDEYFHRRPQRGSYEFSAREERIYGPPCPPPGGSTDRGETKQETNVKTTFRTMDISDLGDNATYDDLAAFQMACERKQQITGWSDEKVTEWVWNNGDWAEIVTGMGF